ncbi:MAG: tetratricopeptide repeat protein [Betaproteobacteria bacterium]
MAADARGDVEAAARAWGQAVVVHPDGAVALNGLAQALIRAGRPGEALPLLERATARDPGMPGAWLALGVVHSLLDQHAQAVLATTRAVLLAPKVAAVQVGHGDVLRRAGQLDAARAAYATGVDLAPDDPDALNKLAGAERMHRDFEAAQAHLARALTIAPSHPYAIVNLGTLAIERQDVDEARQRLEDALRLPGLPADVAEEASSTLAMLDEHRAMQAALDEARQGGEAAPVERALRAHASVQRRNEWILATLAQVTAHAAGEPSIDDRFARGVPSSDAWPAIEAHHNFRALGDASALARTVDQIAHGTEDSTARELIDYANAVRGRHDDVFAPADGIAWEAWLRWTHLRLVGSHPEFWPGQLKPVHNLLPDNPRVPRAAPWEVSGTLRAALTAIDASVPPGAWRACLRYFALIEIHPFHDGNGRLARYVLNSSLVACGLFPVLRPGNRDEEQARWLNAARDTRDLSAVAEWFGRATHYAAALDREWQERR